ncbi:hypothetical protein ENSA5_23720 [Enhygromyxa salina]|uniref:Uncharacterized protein n=1 Tax=Enhygromyxa salina TaxID=215803 RepID=A0A2S9YB69_9BACT|nr:hypothetical protein [Enhygromyxa salina]PRQ02355.1 hypothetical protein ENSA5_23720 [Enhygromyxa salina]
MSSASIVVLIGAALALIFAAALLLWRRRRGVPAVKRGTRRWTNERTMYAATYEQLGLTPPEPPPPTEDATACLGFEELGLDLAPPVDATTLVKMDTLLPAPPAEAPAPLMSSDLTFHFEVAVNAYAQWRRAMAGPRDLVAIAAGPERGWSDAMMMLVAQFTAADSAPLLACVRDPPSPEARVVAALALLEHRETETLTLLSELLPEADFERSEVLDALALWRGPTADATLRSAAIAQFSWRACAWARLLVRRGLDPGGELLTRYLDSLDPALVCAGFELLAVDPERQYRFSAIVARIHEADPRVHDAAITAGLRIDMDIAWAQCQDLAMAPDRPRLSELAASLATLEGQRRLIAWARDDAAPPHALWCAALTGRAEAIELALARLDTHPKLARACLTHLCANPDADLDWWQQASARFWTDGRWLAGGNFDAEGVRLGIAALGARHRAALARELGIRAPQLPALRLDGFAHELTTELDAAGLAAIDFERGFPWSST